jgi:5,10-methylenetetrahydromethanopterin reductase
VQARWGLGISNCRAAAGVVRAVADAEARGADIAFVAEDINCRDSFALCTLAASATGRIRLATGVVNPYTRNPTSLAMAIATLDEVSSGRAVLGIGTSSPSLIEQQMGIPVGRAIGVMKEAVTIVRALLAGDTVTYAGQRFVYQNAHLDVHPVQDRVPIIFAAMGPQMLQLAGRLADGVLLNVGASTGYVRWAVSQIADGARSAGRDPGEITIAAWLTAYVTDEYENGLQRAREWLATMLSIPAQGELLLERSGLDTSILPSIREHVTAYPHGGDPQRGAEFVPAEVAEQLALIGPIDHVRKRVQAYREAGVDVPVLGPAALRALLVREDRADSDLEE